MRPRMSVSLLEGVSWSGVDGAQMSEEQKEKRGLGGLPFRNRFDGTEIPVGYSGKPRNIKARNKDKRTGRTGLGPIVDPNYTSAANEAQAKSIRSDVRQKKERKAYFPTVAAESIHAKCCRCDSNLGAEDRILMSNPDGELLQMCWSCVGYNLFGLIREEK